MAWQVDNDTSDVNAAALWWMNSKQDIWREWVTVDAANAITVALAAGEIACGWPENGGGASGDCQPSVAPTPTATPVADADLHSRVSELERQMAQLIATFQSLIRALTGQAY